MNICKYVLVLALVIFSGCVHYQTINDSTNINLRPRVLKGPLNEIQQVAYEAAKKAFPDETENIKVEDNNKVIILREWFWRGDTIIKILIDKSLNNEFILNVESMSSSHRLNPSMGIGSVAKKEIQHYLNYLDEEYKLYLTNKNSVSAAPAKPLEEKLVELKQAFEKGLITESEYKTKRKEIIDKY